MVAAIPVGALILTLASINADAQRVVPGNGTFAAKTNIGSVSVPEVHQPEISLASRFAAGRPGAVAIPDAVISHEAPAWLEMRVRRGDTIGELFARHGLRESDWRQILDQGGDAALLSRLRVGDVLHARKDSRGQLLELTHQVDESRSLYVKRVGAHLQAEIQHAMIERRVNYAADIVGEDDGSVFASGQKVGLSDRVIMQLFEVFRWDIDFALDLQPGDRYSVVYEEIYRNGEKLRDGNILAAEFTNRGRTLRAVRYTNRQGESEYYTPSGDSLHKAFIRTPVAFSRISSHFNLRRRHPVLNRIRAHRGVDYAAPTGTPIRATGNGRIVFRGRRNGYGNCIVIRHANNIETLYGHMSRFAKGMDVGTRVKQSQLIGYVGKTGLATGPHLHYEFRVNGRHMNPLTVKLPNAAPLPAQYRVDFQKSTAHLITQLDHLRHLQVAQAKD